MTTEDTQTAASEESTEPAVHCSFDEMVDPAVLIPHPRNPNHHSDAQIALLAKIVRHTGWRSPITVSTRSGFIVSGHARLAAGLLLKCAKVPVDRQDFATEADEWAHLVADNRLNELADMDVPSLKDLLLDIDTGAFDMDLTGFDQETLENLMASLGPQPVLPNIGAEETVLPGEISSSQVRMVQLFLTVETLEEFNQMETALRERFATDNVTDTVMASLRALAEEPTPE